MCSTANIDIEPKNGVYYIVNHSSEMTIEIKFIYGYAYIVDRGTSYRSKLINDLSVAEYIENISYKNNDNMSKFWDKLEILEKKYAEIYDSERERDRERKRNRNHYGSEDEIDDESDYDSDENSINSLVWDCLMSGR